MGTLAMFVTTEQSGFAQLGGLPPTGVQVRPVLNTLSGADKELSSQAGEGLLSADNTVSVELWNGHEWSRSQGYAH